MDSDRLKQILEAALLAAGRPLSLGELESVFTDDGPAPGRDEIRAALAELAEDWQSRSLALQQVASGYRAQVRSEFEPWLARLWEEKPPRYSRALLETLALIAYRQPITRPEIEDVRGVSVSTNIMRTLQEREWVRVVGHRDAPGKPAMYGTTRQFLDYFNLRSLDQLPPISEIRDLEAQYPELALEEQGEDAAGEPVPLQVVGGSAGSGAAGTDDEAVGASLEAPADGDPGGPGDTEEPEGADAADEPDAPDGAGEDTRGAAAPSSSGGSADPDPDDPDRS